MMRQLLFFVVFLVVVVVFFRKQEKCQKIAANGGVSISETDMVLQLQLHIVKTGMVNSAYTK